ncbi:MAG TPA: branched-chain amino acid ABC transporter substrate-binding protein [Actinoplanes sp.]|nr:branched-chain amino acid ABC transporter substrate-binding protein [Actinoplanes sp.]
MRGHIVAATVTAVLLASTGCGPALPGPAAATTVFIATDLPLQGDDTATSQETNQAIQLYLEQAGGKAGAFPVELRLYDDASTIRKSWDPETCVKNAHDHVVGDEVAVIGTYNSGCARLMVPIMNDGSEGPLTMVSHANSNPGLTKAWGRGEPQKFYPGGKRSFARVAASDDQSSLASAAFVSGTLKRKRCYVLNDGQVYGKGLATAFVAAAGKYGIRVLGNDVWDVGKTSYTSLFRKIEARDPDCVVVAGDYTNNGKQIILDKVAVLGSNRRVTMMAPGFSGYADMAALPQADGMYLAFGGLSRQQMTADSPAAAKFVAAYSARFGAEPATVYSLYGVAAVQVVLAAIAASDGTRAGVHQALFGATDLTVPATESITGQALTIDHSTGDLTSNTITISVVRGGKETFLSSTRVS